MSKYPYDIKQQLFERRLKKRIANSSLPPCFSLNDLLISAVHLHENEFLKSIGLDSQEINENGNYDTKKMRTKMQKAFYSINDSTLPYLIADYLYRNNIIFTDEQISYIKNKFGNNDFNFEFDYLGSVYDKRNPSSTIGSYVFDIYQKTYVRASKTCDNSKNKLNKFQKFLCEFFSSFGQFTLCLVSFIMIPAIILSFASVGIVLGPLALGLTIGICGSLALSSGVIYMLTEKNKTVS